MLKKKSDDEGSKVLRLKQYIFQSLQSLMGLADDTENHSRVLLELFDEGRGDLGELCEMAATFMLKCGESGNLKYPLLSQCVAALGEHERLLDFYIEDEPADLWVVSDSWLCFGTVDERKDFLFEKVWPAHRHLWQGTVRRTTFGICGTQKLLELVETLKKICQADPIAQGDPQRFRGHVCFCTSLNDVVRDKICLDHEYEHTCRKACEYFQHFPMGTFYY